MSRIWCLSSFQQREIIVAEYQAPLRDMQFVLNEVFKAEELWQTLPAYEDVDADTAGAIIEEAGRIVGSLIAPLMRSGDEEECQFNDGVVTTPKGFVDAFKTFAEGGWIGLAGNPAYEGMGMPKMLSVLYEEMLYAGDNSFALYSALTSGACLALDAHASEELKNLYLPKMYSGEWTGTMCLTEPHSGTDLGIIRTKAEPQDDGSYLITGTKIFITGGEHDLVDNIIHLVLAKLPDAPEGTRGISLFLVPKVNINAAGELLGSNAVSCGSIEHKMGIKASATCVMNFDGSKGYLVGEVNKGLAAMFTMMNYERLSIGIQGIGCASRSYQNAVEYARERLQSRSATGVQNPEGIADPIIVHADVRRMLMNMRALTEGGRAFAAYVGMQLDKAKHAEGDVQKKAENLAVLLTPIAKAFFTDMGLESCVEGQQVFGGHGYVREWGQEQLVRDVRIAQIYEGTNGIQSLDLLGRKVARNGGAFMAEFIEEMKIYTAQASNRVLANQLVEATSVLQDATDYVLTTVADDANIISAAAVEYLHLAGYVAYAYMWLQMAESAQEALESGSTEGDFYSGKIAIANYYFAKVLPRIASLAATVKAGSESLYALTAEQF